MTDREGLSIRKGGISTHTSLAGRDAETWYTDTVTDKFLLTRPSRDVTDDYDRIRRERIISTHTSLAGRDRYARKKLMSEIDFYSHVPRGT